MDLKNNQKHNAPAASKIMASMFLWFTINELNRSTLFPLTQQFNISGRWGEMIITNS